MIKLPTISILRNTRLKLFSLLVFSSFFNSLLAQTQVQEQLAWEWLEKPTVEDPFKYSGKTLSHAASDLASVIKFIEENYPELRDQRTGLAVHGIKQSPIGSHYSFYQTFNDVKIYGTEVKVNLRNGNRVSSVFATLVNTLDWDKDILDIKPSKVDNASKVVYFDGENAEGAWYYEIHNDNEHHHIKVVERENGAAFISGLERNKKGGPKDTLVWVYVFNPDPLTTAGVVYGAPFVNANDSDIAELNEERQLKQVRMNYSNNSIWAENEHVKLISVDDNFAIPSSKKDTFNYTRGQDAFEFIMAIYHLTTYKEYLNSLGFDSVVNYQINVKPRAFDDDNSNFIRTFNSGGKGVLNFGHSTTRKQHVDDAEDADVLIHEYAHAISYNVNLNELDGAARRALDEGVCDYFAASYSNSLSDFRYDYVYSWDGHNPYWEGRFCFTDKNYNDYASNKTIYENGEIYAAVLTDIHDAIGREITDKILISSMYEYADKMPFKVAAELFIKAELELYKGKYHDTICSILKTYQFVNEEFCKTGISGNDVIEKNIVVDKEQFYNNSQLNISFNTSFTGLIKVMDASGKLVYNGRLDNAATFSKYLDVRSGVYFVVLNDGWSQFSERIVK